MPARGRVPVSHILSLFGSAGLGEHWRQNPSAEFPYYVLRVGVDLDLNSTETWNIISFRYRMLRPPSRDGFYSQCGPAADDHSKDHAELARRRLQ